MNRLFVIGVVVAALIYLCYMYDIVSRIREELRLQRAKKHLDQGDYLTARDILLPLRHYYTLDDSLLAQTIDVLCAIDEAHSQEKQLTEHLLETAYGIAVLCEAQCKYWYAYMIYLNIEPYEDSIVRCEELKQHII